MADVVLTDGELFEEALKDLEVACAEMYGEATRQLQLSGLMAGDPYTRALGARYAAWLCSKATSPQ